MVTNSHMISFRSTITQKVLAYFFLNKTEKRYVNELARQLDIDPKNLDTKLKELKSEGLLVSEFHGKQRYYSLNKKFPLLKEYLSIFNKTLGVEQRLTTLFGQINGVKEAYIFGSYAKNKMNVWSDIDLLIVGNHKCLDAQKAILPIQKELNREINIIDMTSSEFENKKANNDPLIEDILHKPMIKLI